MIAYAMIYLKRSDDKGGIVLTYGIVFLIIIFLVLFIIAAKTCYVKAPPNVAYIISGITKNPRILIGIGGFKIPLLERVDMLYLGQMSVDIKTSQSVPTNDFINVKVDAVAKIIVDKENGIYLAARNFLNMEPADITRSLQDSLEGNMREIIGTLDLKKINVDRDSFSDEVLKKAAKDMEKLGISILSCNIQNVVDDNGLIVDLGADNTAKIRKDASISKAVAERDVAIAEAAAKKEANDAQVHADLAIAQRQNELSIAKSELKRTADIKKAEADAAYAIQQQEQQKSIEVATVNAQIAKAEREADLKKQEVLVKEQILAATIQKQADADKYRVEQDALAEQAKRQREAEAQRYAMEQEAAAIKAKGDAEAYAIRVRGEAEAAAIKAKGEAEAAAMDKKAEAMKKYGQAAMAQMAIEVLPQVAKEVAAPLSKVDKITLYGEGGMGSLSGNVPSVMAKVFDTVKSATGIDLQEIAKGDTYDAKVNKNISIDGKLPEIPVEISKEE